MNATTRLVLGLMGGLGSGKSTVARLVARHAPGQVVDADDLAHEALDACARDGRVEEAFGPGYVRPDGTADRQALAARVFTDPAALHALEQMTHPGVRARIQDAVDEHRRGEGPRVLVLDVPLLIEVGLDRSCDALWYVEASEETRRRRAALRGLPPEEVLRREANQSPLERKKARADHVLVNEGEEADLERRVIEGLAILGVRPAAHA